ncbi:arsenical pump membrane protein [Allocatelliglobosispora scoriae]|uniref:Arsenical pump membrane protein n=1 Tax=Allocatelliglobosispora scoriae TaxID=643052 RepID=A0A841C3D6_9ACTN|nr:SLC13 family permease [Allocatelliglobosispora scoriae]MBB5873829.1 arsenical pump membrane protein [Allocatelliglobosispora scoriae]
MDEAPSVAEPPPLFRRVLARLEFLDWLAIGLLVAGGLAVATGALPTSVSSVTLERIAPLLAFLAAVIVLAELTAQAEVFDVIASRITIWAGGSNVVLFGLCLGFAALTTIFLNLDTTAVLLTPVMLATAYRAGVDRLPLAMTTVWLANTASLLLPVSNLTNLLAADRIGLRPLEFAARMALPQVAALVVVAVCLWVFYWRHNAKRYTPPAPHTPSHRNLFIVASISCLVFIVGILVGWAIWAIAAVCAAVLVVAFAVWDRTHLRWSLIPWRLLAFVTGLFLVVDTIFEWGLSHVMTALIGTDPGASGVWRAATTGGVLSNLLNNLPTYLTGEHVIPVANGDQLFGLLIGTNVGPLITPWASLATLLWLERCRSAGVEIKWGRFLATGAITAVAVLVASIASLLYL